MRRYYFDTKPFILTACFIMKCDVICYDYMLKMVGHGQQCTVMYELKGCCSWLKTSALIEENSYICCRTVKLDGQSKMFACVLAVGRHWRCTHQYNLINIIYNKNQCDRKQFYYCSFNVFLYRISLLITCISSDNQQFVFIM